MYRCLDDACTPSFFPKPLCTITPSLFSLIASLFHTVASMYGRYVCMYLRICLAMWIHVSMFGRRMYAFLLLETPARKTNPTHNAPDSCAPVNRPDARMPLQRLASTRKCLPPCHQRKSPTHSPTLPIRVSHDHHCTIVSFFNTQKAGVDISLTNVPFEKRPSQNTESPSNTVIPTR